MAQIIQLRRGSYEKWAINDPILKDWELWIETDTKKIKIWNGISKRSELQYATSWESTAYTAWNNIIIDNWVISATNIWGDIEWIIEDQEDLQNILNSKTNEVDFLQHANDTSNPHNTTKSQVGLWNVDNTSDLDKPISTATQNELNTKENTANKWQANWYASLDVNAKIPEAQIPAVAITDTFVVANDTARDNLTVEKWDIAIVENSAEAWNEPASYIYDWTEWKKLKTPTDAVNSVNGKNWVVVLEKWDIWLSNVENYWIATQWEAEAGIVNNKYMTPQRTKQAIEELAPAPDLSNYLAKDNTTSFTPTWDFNPATKKYVDEQVGLSWSWTVTSVWASWWTWISVSGSPITNSWTITITNTAPHQATNLWQWWSWNSRTITSSTWNNVTISTATTSNAWYMSTWDKTKLDWIESWAQVNVWTNLSIWSSTWTVVRVDSSTWSSVTIPNASESVAWVITNWNQTIAWNKTFTWTTFINRTNWLIISSNTATNYEIRVVNWFLELHNV